VRFRRVLGLCYGTCSMTCYVLLMTTNSAEYKKAFWEVFHSVPKARAMSVDGVSYEELEFYDSCTTRARVCGRSCSTS